MHGCFTGILCFTKCRSKFSCIALHRRKIGQAAYWRRCIKLRIIRFEILNTFLSLTKINARFYIRNLLGILPNYKTPPQLQCTAEDSVSYWLHLMPTVNGKSKPSRHFNGNIFQAAANGIPKPRHSVGCLFTPPPSKWKCNMVKNWGEGEIRACGHVRAPSSNWKD